MSYQENHSNSGYAESERKAQNRRDNQMIEKIFKLIFTVVLAPLITYLKTTPGAIKKAEHTDGLLPIKPGAVAGLGIIWFIGAALVLSQWTFFTWLAGLLLVIALARATAATAIEQLPFSAIFQGFRNAPRSLQIFTGMALLGGLVAGISHQFWNAGHDALTYLAVAALIPMALSIGRGAQAAREARDAQRSEQSNLVAGVLGLTEELVETLHIMTRTEDGVEKTVVLGLPGRLVKPREVINARLESISSPWEVEVSTLEETVIIPLSAETIAARAVAAETGGLVGGFEALEEDSTGEQGWGGF